VVTPAAFAIRLVDRNKLRSRLTALGIIIGVFAWVAMVRSRLRLDTLN
jgi:hypothetical protein